MSEGENNTEGSEKDLDVKSCEKENGVAENVFSIKSDELDIDDSAVEGKFLSSKQLCEKLDIQNISGEYSAEDFDSLLTYRAFYSHIRPLIQSANPKIKTTKISKLMSLKWKEFQSLNPNLKDRLESPAPPFEKPSKSKRRSFKKLVAPLRIKLGKKTKRESAAGSSTDEEGYDRDDVSSYNSEEDAETGEDDSFRRSSQRLTNRKKPRNASKRKSLAEDSLSLIKPLVASTSSNAANNNSQDGYETEHQDYCEVCQQGGEILLCDTCPRAYHLVCLDPELEEPPSGKWSCPKCEEDGILPDNEDYLKEENSNKFLNRSSHKEDVDIHNEFCHECKDGGDLLCCDSCTAAFHIHCLNPPMISVPEGEWHCPECSVEPVCGVVKKILTWRWLTSPDNDKTKEEKDEAKRKKEFFVKFANKSYWACEWISEARMRTYFKTYLMIYLKRCCSDEPPMAEENSEYTAASSKHHSSSEDLFNRYYKWGVRPEWLQIQRIINQATFSKCQKYLVKWKDLPYSQITWENPDDKILNLVDFDKAISEYKKHRSEILSTPHKTKPNKSKYELNERKKLLAEFKKKLEVQPEALNESGGKLHPYQLEGLNWLRFSYTHNIQTILADEMGLGKTVQTISFLYSLFKEGISRGPFLISVPLSTLINWERELEFWAPDFYVVTYIGDKESRANIREHEFTFTERAFQSVKNPQKIRKDHMLKFHVLLTSYELVTLDQATLSSIDWEVGVIDEAHRLKSSGSKFFKVMFRFNLGHKILLTGTPLQNNLEELYNLLNFLSPDRFNDQQTFLAEFAEISKEDQIHKLHDLLGPHMLRRLKADVLKSLPSKKEVIVPVNLTAMQKKCYQHILTRNFEALNSKTGGRQTSLQFIIMDLKKCCNHPFLFSAFSANAPLNANGSYQISDLISACGKMVVMSQMMNKLKERGHRVLIFSQMTTMLDVLEDFCDGMGYVYERIDGNITGTSRQDSIDRFNAPDSPCFVFLLSTKAGGLGINLATADTVIIFDSDWNPHNDIQALSRAHRIGQMNTVMIYRFLTRGTIEEKVAQVAKKKMMLTHLVVRPGMGGQSNLSLTKKELDDIIRFGAQEIFKEENEEGSIVYDDKAIEELLDRSNVVNDGEITTKYDDYLASFKMATYKVLEENLEEEEEKTTKEDEPTPEVALDQDDPEYWEKLLRHHYEQESEDISRNLGKGKRIRKQVNYNDEATSNKNSWKNSASAASGALSSDANNNKYMNVEESDYLASSSSNYDDDDDDLDDDDEDFSKPNHHHSKDSNKNKSLPPLISKSHASFEILGFNIRQRRAFLNCVLRFGIPSSLEGSVCHVQWLSSRDLRCKREKDLKAYIALFMRHLCEPENNGDDEESKCFSDGVPKEGLARQHVLSRIGIMALIRKKVIEFQGVNGTQSTIDNNERTSFMFNIQDGGFTELHSLWENEESFALPHHTAKIWHRRHDYWLLAGIVTHGYARWQDIQADSRFIILNEPFKLDATKANFLEMKNKFLARRFKLLEQALVIEEELRRATFLSLTAESNPTANALLQRFAQAHSLVESNQHLSKEAAVGNRPANGVLRKVLNQLEELLTEMKQDVSHLPATLSRMLPSEQRLGVSETSIINHLTSVLSSQPSKYPFLSSEYTSLSSPFISDTVVIGCKNTTPENSAPPINTTLAKSNPPLNNNSSLNPKIPEEVIILED